MSRDYSYELPPYPNYEHVEPPPVPTFQEIKEAVYKLLVNLQKNTEDKILIFDGTRKERYDKLMSYLYKQKHGSFAGGIILDGIDGNSNEYKSLLQLIGDLDDNDLIFFDRYNWFLIDDIEIYPIEYRGRVDFSEFYWGVREAYHKIYGVEK